MSAATSTRRLPDDILTEIAESVAMFTSRSQMASGSSLAGTCSAFLRVGLGQRYGSLRLYPFKTSWKLLKHIRASPLIHPFVHTLQLDLDPSYDPYHHVRRPDRDPPFDHASFMAEFGSTCETLVCVREININWAAFVAPSNIGRPSFYDPQPTLELSLYGRTILDIVENVASSLRVLRVQIYVDAVPLIAQLKPGVLTALKVLDLRVFGGTWPIGVDQGEMANYLSEVASNVALPSASSLKELHVFLAPMNDGHRQRLFDIYSQPKTPQIDTRGFFYVLSRTTYPLLSRLVLEIEFSGDMGHVASIIRSGVTSGSLTSLELRPSSSQGVSGRVTSTRSYMEFLRRHGHDWTGLRHLSVYLPSVGREEHDGLDEPVDANLLILLPILSSAHQLESLEVKNRYLESDDLHALLQEICSSLQQLTVSVAEVRPSVIEDLAVLGPAIETLHLTLKKTSPGWTLPRDAIEAVEDELRIPTTIANYATFPPGSTERWRYEDFMQDRGRRAKSIASERLFHAEMQDRRYDHWALRRASIIQHWHPGCCADTPPPRHVLNAALALQRAVPGLTFAEVRPLRKRWMRRSSLDDNDVNELHIVPERCRPEGSSTLVSIEKTLETKVRKPPPPPPPKRSARAKLGLK